MARPRGGGSGSELTTWPVSPVTAMRFSVRTLPENLHQITQPRPFAILVRQRGASGGGRPRNPDVRVVPGDAAIILRRMEVRHLV